MKTKNILFLFGILILFGIVTAGTADAVTYNTTGNPGDTAAGTVISASAESASLDYTDINANAKPTVHPNLVQILVLPTYGFTMALLEDQNMYVNKIVTNETGITNEGNASDSITITAEASYVNTTGTWVVKLRINRGTGWEDLHTFTSPHESYTTTEVLSEDTEILFAQEVTAPDTDGTPGAYIIITTEASTSNSPVGEYTGANGLTYGGPGSTSETTRYDLFMPLLTLTRTATVDSPIVYQTLPTAGPHDAVPGSVITYTLNYSNTGNTSAANVVLIDKVPSSEGIFQTNLAHFNADNAPRTNVTITANQSKGSDWIVYYSLDANPSKAWVGAPDSEWTMVGTISGGSSQFPGNELYTTTSSEYNAVWVKFEKALVADDEDGNTLTYGVTIR